MRYLVEKRSAKRVHDARDEVMPWTHKIDGPQRPHLERVVDAPSSSSTRRSVAFGTTLLNVTGHLCEVMGVDEFMAWS